MEAPKEVYFCEKCKKFFDWDKMMVHSKKIAHRHFLSYVPTKTGLMMA